MPTYFVVAKKEGHDKSLTFEAEVIDLNTLFKEMLKRFGVSSTADLEAFEVMEKVSLPDNKHGYIKRASKPPKRTRPGSSTPTPTRTKPEPPPAKLNKYSEAVYNPPTYKAA